MTMGEKIRLARKEAKMTQEELARKADGPSRTQIIAYEKNHYQPSIDNLEKIAIALGKPMAYFYSDQESPKTENQFSEFSPGLITLPVYKNIPVGTKDVTVSEYVSLPGSLVAGADFAHRVKSIEMAPRIVPGDLVMVRKQKFFEDGNIILVRLKGAIEIFRAFHKGAKISLLNLNGQEVFQSAEIEIIGKVVKNISSFE